LSPLWTQESHINHLFLTFHSHKHYWQASETLPGDVQLRIVLFIYIYVYIYIYMTV